MRSIIILLFLLCSMQGFCQNIKSNYDTSMNEFYVQVQNTLYQLDHSNLAPPIKKEKTFSTISDFIKKHPAEEIDFSLIAAAVNLTVLQIDSLMKLVDTSLNASPYKQNALATRRRLTITETGKKFTSLELVDTLNKKITVDNFLGKIILIDFWSSWCGPCRKQIPALKKIYAKYKKNGFEIIGISLDNDKPAWLKAIKDDKQPWPQYCELKGWRENKIARYLNIYSIPSNFLLDKNGIILGQDLSPEQIDYMISLEK